MNKLALGHIIAIGIVVSVIVAGVMYFVMIKPKKEDTESTLAAAASTRQNGGTEEMINQKKKELAKTEADAKETEAKWKVNDVKYMPKLPYDDKTSTLDLYFKPEVGRSSKGKLTGFRDIPTAWGEWLTAWYDAQKRLGVEREPGVVFPIEEFPTDPNALTARLQNHLTFPKDGGTWPVKLKCKDFNAALDHLKRFNSMERHGMPVINNVAISGHSPDLELSYDLAIYIIPRTAPPVPEPMIGGGAGAPAGGGVPAMPGAGGGSPVRPSMSAAAGAGGGKKGKGDE